MIRAMKHKGFKSLCKVLAGITFCFLVVWCGMMFSSASVRASSHSCGSTDINPYPSESVGTINSSKGKYPLHKTWTFYVLSTEPLNLQVWGYRDGQDPDSHTDYGRAWNSGNGYDDTISITTSGKKDYKDSDNVMKYKYTITMNKTRIDGRTPWLDISAKNTSAYTVQQVVKDRDVEYYSEPAYKTDPYGCCRNATSDMDGSDEKWDEGHVHTYMGYSFHAKIIRVPIKYNLQLDLDGGKITNPAAKSTYPGFYAAGERLTGGIIGSASVAKDGYTFKGWSGGGTIIYDQYGNLNYPAGSKTIKLSSGEVWCENGIYKYNKCTYLKAVWEKNPEKYNLTLDFNGADSIPKYTGTYKKINEQKYTYTPYFTEGTRSTIYGSGSVKKANYVFRGWYWSNGTTETKVFDSSGNPIPDTVLGNGEKIFDSKGNYVRKSGTELYARYYATTTIKYHAENEANSFSKKYTEDEGQKLTKVNDWWKQQRKGSTWIGWSETKDSSKVGYSDECSVSNPWIRSHVGKTVDLYSVWDKPTAKIAPTTNNTSFNCNGTTYYKAPVEFEVTGSDDVFEISSVSIWSSRDGSRIDSNTSSYKTKFGVGDCISTDLIRAYGECTAGDGVSETVSCDAHLDETAPTISSNVMDYGSGTVKTSSSDSQSGVATITLEYLRDGTWNEKTHYDTNSAEYGSCDSRISVGSTYYGCKHRIKVTDHVGNTSYTRPFFVVPLELTTLLSKYNGDTAYNTQTLTFIAGGDLTATLKVKVSGYPDRIKYEYAPELGQATEEYNVTPNESGNVYETKTFTVPYTIPHDTDYYVKVTAYRTVDDDNTDVVSTIEYVRMADIDFSIFKSKIIYQSGMHM